jgi:hypothetical protein
MSSVSKPTVRTAARIASGATSFRSDRSIVISATDAAETIAAEDGSSRASFVLYVLDVPRLTAE